MLKKTFGEGQRLCFALDRTMNITDLPPDPDGLLWVPLSI